MKTARHHTKSPAQLDREIAEALASPDGRRSRAWSRVSHAVVADVEGVDDDEIFEVANDAFKEGDLRRAEDLVGQMRDPWVARCVKKITHVVPKTILAPRRRSKRTLYKLYRPMAGRLGTQHRWVIATAAAYNPDVTLLYPATEDGTVIEYVELAALVEVNHDAVVKHHGYRVVECEGKPRKPRASHATRKSSAKQGKQTEVPFPTIPEPPPSLRTDRQRQNWYWRKFKAANKHQATVARDHGVDTIAHRNAIAVADAFQDKLEWYSALLQGEE